MTTPLNRIRSGGIALIAIFVLSVIGFHFIGGYGWIESMWMVVITISTVGYGEQSMATSAVQLLMMAVILLGVSATAYTFGGFVQLMLEGEIDRALGRRKMTKVLNRLDDHVIICGFGKLGRDLATQLKHREIPFVIVDLSEEKVERAIEAGFLAIEGDATVESVLEEVQLEKAKALATTLSIPIHGPERLSSSKVSLSLLPKLFLRSCFCLSAVLFLIFGSP
jgi:voltage-gated potassium channel